MSLAMSNYTETLKRIKDAEEASNREVAEKKKSLEAELHDLEKVSDESIEVAKKDADLYVTNEVEAARELAQKDAEALLGSSRRQADTIASRKLTKRELQQAVSDIVFSEFKSE